MKVSEEQWATRDFIDFSFDFFVCVYMCVCAHARVCVRARACACRMEGGVVSEGQPLLLYFSSFLL